MSWRTLWPVLALALIAFIPTGKFIFGGLVPAPVDQIHQLPPWNGPKPDTPWDILQLDGALQFLPWRDYMLDSMRHGYVPLWNSYTFGGTPFLANSQSAPLYPLHWLWPFGAESLLSFSAWLHLFIAGLGVYLLCRRLGATVLGALLGGIALEMSAFMVAWIQLPSVGMTASWIPWCLLGVLRVFEEPGGKSFAKLAAPVALMFLAGHLQIAAFGLMACGLYALWLAVFRRSFSRFVYCMAALLLGAIVAAPQLMPSIENGRNGHRSSVATAEGWESYRAQALKPEHLATLFIPNAFGMPNEFSDEQPTMPSYWLGLEEPGRHYAELAFWVGPVVLPLAMLGFWIFRRRPEVSFFALLFVFAITVALGTIVARALYFGIPGWAATGSPGRIAILSSVALCVLGALGFNSGFEMINLSKDGTMALPKDFASLRGHMYPAMCFLICSLFILLSKLWVSRRAESVGYPLNVLVLDSAIAAASFSIIGYAGALVGAFAHHRNAFSFAIVAVLAAIGVPSFVHWRMNPGSPKGEFNASFPGLEFLHGKRLAVINDGWSFYSVPKDAVAPPNSLLPYGIEEAGGYDSIIPRTTKAELDSINRRDSAPPENGNMMFVKPYFDNKKLRTDGFDYILSTLRLNTIRALLMPEIYRGKGWAIYKIPGVPNQTIFRGGRFDEKLLDWTPQMRDKTRAWLDSPEADGWYLRYISYDLPSGLITATYNPKSYRLGILLGLFGTFALVALSCMRATKVEQDESTSSTESP